MTLDQAIKLNIEFYEHTYFEDDAAHRSAQNERFISGKDVLPIYDYPKLAAFTKDKTLVLEQKTQLQEAIAVIAQAQRAGELSAEKAQLYIGCYSQRVRRIELVEAAAEMLAQNDSDARKDFTRLNNELFGGLDTHAWLDCMIQTRKNLVSFEPANKVAVDIKKYLEVFFVSLPSAPISSLVDSEIFDAYRPHVSQRYEKVLAVVPETDDSVYYDAAQCAEIMRSALTAGGFQSWQTVVDTDKFATSTNSQNRTISLPAQLSRTAAELQRLIIHEQETHARRGENGSKHSGLLLLQQGTANYSAAEEGLGVFLEMILAGDDENAAVTRARDRYITAGLATGADGTARNARDTFEVLWRIIALRSGEEGKITADSERAAKKVAVGHIENAFRGTDGREPGIIYAKLQVYYSGLLKNIAYAREIAADPETFEQKYDEMFIGKYNHTDPEERALVLASI